MRTNLFRMMAVVFTLAFISCSGGDLTDKRDGKAYKTVKIGEQIWMAENLNFEVEGSKCYADKAESCEKYGRLYNWKTAMEVCPKGWHLPTNMEWDKLYHYADGTLGKGSTASPYRSETASKFLKATSGWNDNRGGNGESIQGKLNALEGVNGGGNGEDKFGFTALPGGTYFYNNGNAGYWWSASEADYDNRPDQYRSSAYYRYIGRENNTAWTNPKTSFYSVRCLRD